MIRRPGGRIIVLAVVGVLSAAACASPIETADDEPGPSQIASRHDAAIMLALERPVIVPGQPVGATVLIRNLGRQSVLWRGNGCRLDSTVGISPSPIARPAERPKADLLGALLATVTDGASGPAPFVKLDDGRGRLARSCGVDHGFSELAPGAVLRCAATWAAVTVLGAPAEPGAGTSFTQSFRSSGRTFPSCRRRIARSVTAARSGSSCRCELHGPSVAALD